MLKKISATLSLMVSMTCLPVYADNYTSCSVELAVSSPPIQLDQRVAFNVSNENGINRSITLSGGSAPVVFDQLICSGMPYMISATLYSTSANKLMQDAPSVGECVLRAGPIVLGSEGSSVSAVFPNDFNCE